VEPERRFLIKTYGCQMNVHDSQKVANLLHHAGYTAAARADDADLLVVNTCSIREKAENQLYSDLGALRRWKAERPGRILGVGGCVAQQVGDGLLRRFAHLDFVFGTHNLRWVPHMVAAAEEGGRSARLEEDRSLDRFDLPERHPGIRSAAGASAFLTVMEGCDMFCSFCIVPLTRGREISRPAGEILAEAEALVAGGVQELTLLGQTVNAYGRHDVGRGRTLARGTMAFAQLLGELDALPGLERIRYASPHPLFFDDDLIRAHGELESLCPHVHLPVQSGSSRLLERMRRRYTRERYLEIVAALRAARPDIAITTDLIVGFPGETQEDFEATLSLIEEARFVDHFSFKYSPRPGTAAAAEASQAAPAEVAQCRLEAVQSLQRSLTLAYHRARVGSTTEALIEGQSRRGGGQVCGRDPYHRVVNVATEATAPVPGARVAVEIVEATPHSLIGRPLASPLPAAFAPKAAESRA